jgi:hypothetical protein
MGCHHKRAVAGEVYRTGRGAISRALGVRDCIRHKLFKIRKMGFSDKSDPRTPKAVPPYSEPIQRRVGAMVGDKNPSISATY